MNVFDAQNIVLMLALICALAAGALLFRRRLKVLLKMSITGLAGLVIIYFSGGALGIIGVTVGVNPINFAVAALFGLPGVLTLVFVQLILSPY
jgi:hypothetical protein